MAPPVRTGNDPTKAVLSESALSVHGVCDYVVNVATGCRHGCAFCYVPLTPPVRDHKEMIRDHSGVDAPRENWGGYVLFRVDLPERLDDHLDRNRTWRETDRGRGIVGVSFGTDPYMDARAAGIATDVVRVLTDHDKYVRVLTRNPTRALRDLEVFQKAGDFVTVGTSIPSFDADAVRALEPQAPAPASRLEAMESFAEAGVQVYTSWPHPRIPTLTQRDCGTSSSGSLPSIQPLFSTNRSTPGAHGWRPHKKRPGHGETNASRPPSTV